MGEKKESSAGTHNDRQRGREHADEGHDAEITDEGLPRFLIKQGHTNIHNEAKEAEHAGQQHGHLQLQQETTSYRGRQNKCVLIQTGIINPA